MTSISAPTFVAEGVAALRRGEHAGAGRSARRRWRWRKRRFPACTRLAEQGVAAALRIDAGLRAGLQVWDGAIVHTALAADVGLTARTVAIILARANELRVQDSAARDLGNVMRVFGFAGWSGSGKTTLIEQLIPRFGSLGLTVSLDQACASRIRRRPAGQGLVSPSRRRMSGSAGVVGGALGPDARIARRTRAHARAGRAAAIALRSGAGRRLQGRRRFPSSRSTGRASASRLLHPGDPQHRRDRHRRGAGHILATFRYRRRGGNHADFIAACRLPAPAAWNSGPSAGRRTASLAGQTKRGLALRATPRDSVGPAATMEIDTGSAGR